MKFDEKRKTIEAKIVYYGPALSGKTTSLKHLFKLFDKQDQIKSINSTTGRTLFFDFGILRFKGEKWDAKFLMYSTTGQDYYAVTRPTTVKGADGIIFIADSNVKSFQRNVDSWNELVGFYGEQLEEMPIILNFNKQDLLNKFDIREFFDKTQIPDAESRPYFKTIAITGQNILKSFKKMVDMVFPGVIAC